MHSLARRTLAASVCLIVALAPALAVAQTVKIPEGTEFPLRMEETLSSKTASEGDRFTVRGAKMRERTGYKLLYKK